MSKYNYQIHSWNNLARIFHHERGGYFIISLKIYFLQLFVLCKINLIGGYYFLSQNLEFI